MYRQAAGLEFTLFGEVTTSASVPQWIIAAGNPSALANYPVDAGTLRSALQHYTNVMVDGAWDEVCVGVTFCFVLGSLDL